MKHLLINFLLILALVGCTLPPKSFDHDAESQRVNKELVCAKEIYLQPISINGAKAPQASFDFFVKKLKKYTTKNIVVRKILNLTIEKDIINDFIHYFEISHSLGFLSEKDREAFIKMENSFSMDGNSILMFYSPVLFWTLDAKDEKRGLAFTNNKLYNMVVFNESSINKSPVISDIQAWKIVLTHEIGHHLGVPAKKTHNKAVHCTSRECVMYAQPDWQSVVSVLFNGMPYDFCALCQAELKEAKKLCTED
jgi:hypothetical protein